MLRFAKGAALILLLCFISGCCTLGDSSLLDREFKRDRDHRAIEPYTK
jgi:hypothetical protein